MLSSVGWGDLQLELYQQPEFEIAEHQHTMHVIAYGMTEPHAEALPSHPSGERWLDGKWGKERRHPGDIAMIPAGVPHRCNWTTSVQFMVLALEPALLQRVGQDWVNPDRIELMPRFMTDSDALIQGILLALKQEVESGGIGGPVLVDSLKTALAVHLLRHYCATVPQCTREVDGLSPSRLRLVTTYIHENLHQTMALDDLAAIAQLSPYHFLRLFKQRLGVTPHQYILQCRVDRAAWLLRHSQTSLAEIATTVGFCDQSHLTRCFKRRLGVTPKQFLNP